MKDKDLSEHFEIVERPAVGQAKLVGWIVILLCLGALFVRFYMPSTPLAHFLGTHQTLIVYTLGGVMAVAAIRALLQVLSR